MRNPTARCATCGLERRHGSVLACWSDLASTIEDQAIQVPATRQMEAVRLMRDCAAMLSGLHMRRERERGRANA